MVKIVLTTRQVNGTKFEVWIAQLLHLHKYQNVRQNVEYYQGFDAHRQVDVEYQYVENDLIHRAIIEAKYSSGTKIHHNLRSGSKNKNGLVMSSINTLVDEVMERKMFVDADLAILVTNYFFEDKLKVSARKSGILLIEKPQLDQLYTQTGGRLSLNDSINKINLNQYTFQKSVEILR